MEMALSMGAFEALDNREMMEVDGGVIDWIAVAGAAASVWVIYEIGYAVGKAIAHATSK